MGEKMRGSEEKGGTDPATSFFRILVRCEDWAPDIGRPFSYLHDVQGCKGFLNRRAEFMGCFDEHIRCSIPGFWEAQAFIGQSIVNYVLEENEKPGGLSKNPLKFLDIGCTEGSFIKTLATLTPDGFYSVGIEPNIDCVDVFFNVLPAADRADCVFAALPEEKEAFGSEAWREKAGITIPSQVSQDLTDDNGELTVPFFDPGEEKFDFIQSSMTFQFISRRRAKHLFVCKEMLKPGGILILQEKVSTDMWRILETEKNIYKSYFFSEYMNKQKNEFLTMSGGMNEKLVGYELLWELVASLFNHVVCYWRSGNFVGLIASNDEDNLNRIANDLPPEDIAPFSALSKTIISP
ncbi:MAG: hypothetical protein AB2657_10905 [Candidatus Thiodiazotropha endolucinida]